MRHSCKTTQCIMFRGRKCLIVDFLESEPPPAEQTLIDSDNKAIEEKLSLLKKAAEEEDKEFTSSEPEAPEWLRNRTTEQLVNDVLEYANKRYLDRNEDIPFSIIELFLWDKDRLELTKLPTEIVFRMELVQGLVQRELRQLKKEKK